MLEAQGTAVGEPRLRMGVEERGGADQCAGDQAVVGGEQCYVVTVGPLQQALVVGGDVALVGLVDADLDPRVGGRQFARGLRRVVGRGVVDDEDPDVDAVLFVQDAADAVGEEVAVLVAGDHDTDGGHR